MAEARVERRLVAVLAADVVGYSRMMEADEAGTLAALKRHRETVFDPAVAAHNGRIVKLMGDGAIVEFGSVVDAVNCALSVQRCGAPMAAEKAFQSTIVLRIGINLGDVIIENDDIYGDGVNIAARLEPLAAPGGICVSSIVNESVGNRIDVRFTDGGDISVKNIDRPIRIWTWHPDQIVAAQRSNIVNSERKIETPSIAVLPFTNMSGDAEQEYFSDGISEDIITDLSKITGLMVIARNRWTENPDNSLHLAKHNAELAIQKDPNEPLAHFAASLAAMFGKDLDRAKSEADIALSLNPNFALAYATLGTICAYSGQPLAAIPAIERAMRLDPAWSRQYLHFLGTAYLLAGKHETAAALLRQRVFLVPGTDFTRAVLASALGHLNEIDEARRIWRELKEINPKYSFSEHFARQPFEREEDFRLIAEGLAKAGLST